jgi:hypothetical protein
VKLPRSGEKKTAEFRHLPCEHCGENKPGQMAVLREVDSQIRHVVCIGCLEEHYVNARAN